MRKHRLRRKATEAEILHFLMKVRPIGECLAWIGAKNSGGYGYFWHDKSYIGAHVFAYEHCVGPIPEGLVLDHLCEYRACVCPAHLEPVTQAENIRRSRTVRLSALPTLLRTLSQEELKQITAIIFTAQEGEAARWAARMAA